MTPVAKPSSDGMNMRQPSKCRKRALGLGELFRLDGAEFVDGAYHTLLLRQSDERGRRFYLARLLYGTRKTQILS